MNLTLRAIFALFFFGVFSFCCRGQGTWSVVKVSDGNPSLGIVRFQGDPKSRTVLETMLRRCDWFQVLKDDYVNRAQVQLTVSSAEFRYSVSVVVSGESVPDFRVEESGSDWHDAAAKVTDAILKRLFKVSALCTRPIAYTMTSAEGLKEVYTCRLDGSGQSRLTFNDALSNEVSWGHSGALVYTLNKNHSLQVLLVDYKNRTQRVISRCPGLNSSADLSPDGRYVVLPLSLKKQVDLYLLDLANPSQRTRLTRDRDVESSPVFSPDGTQVCYVSDKTGRPQLYIMDTQGNSSRRLTRGASECVSPDWSPVSRKICYSTRINGQYVIQVIDPAGGTPELITEAAGNWEAPSWAPDGRHIVCTRATGSSQDLYLLDTVFHTFQPLTKGARVSLPAWSPGR